ncbi:MAG: GLPGLI family protein [Muribaculaceae bacterium]|nr:GLPGLI family protein [Muribaculaceae bacterium]
MRQTITIIFMCLTAIAAMAQNNVAIEYDVTNRDTDSGKPYTQKMTLVANPEKSFYFNKMSLYVDSCESTPEGKAKLREIQLKAWRVVQPDGTVTYDGRKLGLAPEKKEFLYVAKDKASDNISVYDFKAGELWRYEEPLSEMEWTIIEDSTKNILGFECIMAQTEYHGRTWMAWFSPEIPVYDGPWKLRGLPGMILNADGGDGFIIEAKEVGYTKQAIPSVYSVKDYTKGKRKQILADHEHYENNFESMMEAQGIKMNGDGSTSNLPMYDRQRRAWETDY